jgi:ATP-dependent Lon protease
MGYTIKEISGKTDRVEVQTMIDNKIKDHVDETKDQYIKIDQVPGLQERLKSIEDGLQDNKEMTQKIYDKLMKLK